MSWLQKVFNSQIQDGLKHNGIIRYSKRVFEDAQEDLRNALAAAARTEKPFVSKHIADMLAMIDTIIDASEMLEKMENRKDGDSGFFGTFFNGDLK